LKEVTTTLGLPLSEEEFVEFWNAADLNHDGKLDYNEFIKMMEQYRLCLLFIYHIVEYY